MLNFFEEFACVMSGRKFRWDGELADFYIDRIKVPPGDDITVVETWLCCCCKALFKTALSILDCPEDAADAVQDSVIKLLKNYRNFRGDASFRTYAMRIVINQSCNILRTRRAFEKHCSLCPAASHAPGADEIFEQKLIANLLAKGVKKLPPAWRRIIYWRYYCGWSYEQIADVLNCSCGTVKSRLFRSKKMLKKYLQHLSKYDF